MPRNPGQRPIALGFDRYCQRREHLELFYQTDPPPPNLAAWVNVGTNFTFGPSGALTSPTTGTISIPN